MDFLDKLRKKPEQEKKTILWSIVIVIGLILTIIWLYNSYKAVNEFRNQNSIMEGIDISNLEQEWSGLEIPEFPEDQFINIIETATQ